MYVYSITFTTVRILLWRILSILFHLYIHSYAIYYIIFCILWYKNPFLTFNMN